MNRARRRLIQAGLMGSALLAGVRWIDRATAASPQAFDSRAVEVIRILVPVVLAGALPADPSLRAKAIGETVDAFFQTIEGLAPAIQEELGEMFSFLLFPPTRIAVARVNSAWSEASAAELAAFLEGWRTSRLELKRAGYRAITQLIQGAWFDNPLAWAVVGYPGPPPLA